MGHKGVKGHGSQRVKVWIKYHFLIGRVFGKLGKIENPIYCLH